MRILALDQASYKTGYALFDGIDLVRWGHSRARRRYDDADKQFNCKDTSS